MLVSEEGQRINDLVGIGLQLPQKVAVVGDEIRDLLPFGKCTGERITFGA